MDIETPTAFDDRDWAREMPDTRLRMAVVGLGWYGQDIAIPAIADAEHCTLTTLVTGSPANGEAVAEEYDAEQVLSYDEYADGVGTDAYDAVYVVTPNARHLDHVRPAAEHGKHVICEKPLEATADRAEQLVAACEEAGVELMTAYRMQTARSARWVRELVRSGAIGDPIQAHGEFSFDLLADGDPDQWRLDPDLAGGGAFMDIGVYPLNTVRFVADAAPVAVSATHTESPPEFAGLDEHVSFQVEYENDLTGSFTSSYGAAGANRMSILGTEGRIVAEPFYDENADRTITIERDGGSVTVDAPEPREMVEEFDYFATGVLTDMEIEPDGRQGLHDVRVAEAVYESSETGRRVDI
jgi:predicted dehydrogenase